MNKQVLKHLQFGYEIEGAFHEKLETLDGEFKEDGSVGSETRLSIPSDFPTLGGNDREHDSDSCDTCNGDGRYWEDCQCEYDEHDCRHEHDDDCESTPEQLRQTPGLSMQNCSHECSDGDNCYYRRCEGDDEYHHVDCQDCDGNGSRSSDGNSYDAEYASKVFLTLDGLCNELVKFISGAKEPKDNTHIWNKTCGLHLHVGIRPNHRPGYKKLWSAAANLEFLRELSDESQTWCECQRTRLIVNDDLYYQFWRNPYDLISTFNKKYPLRAFNHQDPSEKFRFMRFHRDFKTLEFRFLSPCKHKVENVKKLVSLLTDYLGSENTYTSISKVNTNPKVEEFKFESKAPEQTQTVYRGFVNNRKETHVLHHDF